MRFINVYFYKDRFSVLPSNKTKVGVLIASAPCFVLNVDDDSDSFKKVVFDALKLSKTGVPHPVDWKLYDEYFRRTLGVAKSFNIDKKCMFFMVEQDDITNKLVFKPYGYRSNAQCLLEEGVTEINDDEFGNVDFSKIFNSMIGFIQGR